LKKRRSAVKKKSNIPKWINAVNAAVRVAQRVQVLRLVPDVTVRVRFAFSREHLLVFSNPQSLVMLAAVRVRPLKIPVRNVAVRV
jgi:hypothetical protein